MTANAQSFQWIKSGGSAETPYGNDGEGAFSVVTDSQKNIYTISYVGNVDRFVDGTPINSYFGSAGSTDFVISSFACNGSLRWTKLFYGPFDERASKLQIDAQDNIYLVGYFQASPQAFPTPLGIENTITFPQQPIADECLVFIAKFNNMGSMQWLKRLTPYGMPNTDIRAGSVLDSIQTDAVGNSYVTAYLSPGVYFNGQFTATKPLVNSNGYNFVPMYILKFDTNGNIINGIDINIVNNSNCKFYRNKNNGYFYFTFETDNVNLTTIRVNNQTITHTNALACFDQNGQFLWVRENSGTAVSDLIRMHNIDFDASNNIYMSCNHYGANNFFIGHAGVYIGQSQSGLLRIYKINPNATSVLWATNWDNNYSGRRGTLMVKGNEVGFTDSCGGVFTWGGQTINVNGMNQGTKPLLARFNKDTGACLGLSVINNDLSGFDGGKVITADASGDYIIGGAFSSQLSCANGSVITNGGDDDFFIAKFSTQVCSPLDIATQELPKNTLVAYPNPAINDLTICVKEPCNYNIYNISSARVQSGVIDQDNNTINIAKLACGVYNIQVLTSSGVASNVKVLKE
ncbi:MAG: T9SS type A sorting domain-containing protein [Flavobacterium sp.]|nr:T9SS type A sorting domain-containing protein [Flavobacterium sp.]